MATYANDKVTVAEGLVNGLYNMTAGTAVSQLRIFDRAVVKLASRLRPIHERVVEEMAKSNNSATIAIQSFRRQHSSGGQKTLERFVVLAAGQIPGDVGRGVRDITETTRALRDICFVADAYGHDLLDADVKERVLQILSDWRDGRIAPNMFKDLGVYLIKGTLTQVMGGTIGYVARILIQGAGWIFTQMFNAVWERHAIDLAVAEFADA